MSCKALQSKTSNGLMPNYSESVAMVRLIIYDVENTVFSIFKEKMFHHFSHSDQVKQLTNMSVNLSLKALKEMDC